MLALAAAAMAWREHGSIAAEDWLPYGILAGLLLATVFFADGNRPSPFTSAAFGAVLGLSLWTALSVAWSPVPTLARDEALLISVYGVSLAIPALTLNGERNRLAVLGIVGCTGSALALAAAAYLIGGASPDDFTAGRLTFPVSYVNANAAIFLIGFWSAVALASSRPLPAAVRALALGGATAVLAAWLSTQSKGGGIALAASAVVVLALAPGRLRLLVPLLVPSALVAAAYRPLTAPFRADDGNALVAAGRDAGTTLFVLAALAVVAGLGYALVDRRVELSPRAHRAAGALALAALAASLVTGAAVFLVRVDEPVRYASDRWEEFKRLPPTQSGGSHLVNLGSNRYDFWRVQLEGARDHPLAGIGGRGFGSFYLQERRSVETPARGHSAPLDALLETGIVGFALFVALFGVILLALARRAGTASGAAALGTFAYFAVHASGDWIWTFPAVGVPVFTLVGAALAPDEPAALGRRVSLAAGTIAVLVVLLAAVPPVLASRITDEALQSGDPDGLATARRLDPLSTDPWIAEFTLARTDAARIEALRHGLEREPRSVALHLLLGRTLLEAGRREEAVAELEEALRLDPRSEEIAAALGRARQGP